MVAGCARNRVQGRRRSKARSRCGGQGQTWSIAEVGNLARTTARHLVVSTSSSSSNWSWSAFDKITSSTEQSCCRPSVCPSVRLFHRSTAATAAGGFAAERRAGRIDTLICRRRRSAANAGSVMLSAEEGADLLVYPVNASATTGGSIAEWLACWTQAQKGLGSNRSRDAVG